jgi:hypothetical protein
MIFEGHKLINLLPVLLLLSLFSGAAAVGHQQHQFTQDWSVAGADDINGDGFADVIVGVLDYSNEQTREGAAFVYHGSAQGINLIADAVLESNQEFTGLGKSVAGAGDINGDGFADVIVGAHGYDNGQMNEGGVFVYHGSPGGLNTTPAAILESDQDGAHLGYSVAGAGDINKDGFADIIAGAPDYNNGQNAEGAIFVYHGSVSGLNSTPTAILESDYNIALLGWSVAGAGDINKDGFADIIAGAYLYGGDQYNEGAVFVYHGSASGLSTTPAIILEGNQIGAHLGFSVGSAGDVNSDGFDDIIAGAYLYDNGELYEGGVFVYHGSASGLNAIPATILEGNTYYRQLGYSVAGAGDVNKDGFADVIAGAFFSSRYFRWERGEASIHHGSANGVSQTPAILLRGTEANSYLGYPVAGAGDINEDGFADVIAGGYWYSHGDLDQGMPFIYYGSVDGIRLKKNIFLPVLFKFEAK